MEEVKKKVGRPSTKKVELESSKKTNVVEKI